MNTFTIIYIITLIVGAGIICKINRSKNKKVKELEEEIDRLKKMNDLKKYEMKL